MKQDVIYYACTHLVEKDNRNYAYVIKRDLNKNIFYYRNKKNPIKTIPATNIWTEDTMLIFIGSGIWVEITKEEANDYCKRWFKDLDK